MTSRRSLEKEEEKLNSLVNSKFRDYLGRQYIHASFDTTRSDSKAPLPAVYPYERYSGAGCRYNRQKETISYRRFVNPGLPANFGHKTEFVHAAEQRKMMLTRTMTYDRIVNTAQTLMEKLPVTNACKYYNTQYLRKSSARSHRVLHEGAFFNYDNCLCKLNPLSVNSCHVAPKKKPKRKKRLPLIPILPSSSEDSPSVYDSSEQAHSPTPSSSDDEEELQESGREEKSESGDESSTE